MKTLYSRLVEICKDLGIESPRNVDIHRLCNITTGRVAQIKAAGEAARLGEESVRILTKLGYSADWIQDGKGSKLSPSSDTQNALNAAESNVSAAPDIKGRVPLISWVQAGVWSEAVDIYEPGYAERWLPFLKNNGQNVFALRVEGDSMTSRFGNRSYPEGCIIFVDPDQRMPANGDRIVARLEGTNSVTFKVYTEDAGRRWLKPLNEQHPPIYENFTVVGKVIGKWEDE